MGTMRGTTIKPLTVEEFEQLDQIPIELFGVAHSLRLSGIFNGITIK